MECMCYLRTLDRINIDNQLGGADKFVGVAVTVNKFDKLNEVNDADVANKIDSKTNRVIWFWHFFFCSLKTYSALHNQHG